MNYDFNEEQQIIKKSARSFFSKESTGVFIREMEKDAKGYTADLWHKMAELGWLGLLIPECYGGSELSFLDLVVLLYEMGYACLPGPYFSTVVLGGITLLDAGNEKQKKTILSEVAGGNQILTLALTETGGTWNADEVSLTAELQNDHYVLSGVKRFVLNAHIADKIICAVRTRITQGDCEDGVSLLIVDGKSTQMTVQVLDTIGDDKQAEIIFDRVKVPAENLLGEVHQGWSIVKKVLQKASVAKCAEMSGAAQRVLDFAVPFMKEREQFGRPVGSFQAVQHHCANILTFVDTSKLMTMQAAWKISQGIPCEKEASMCKAWVSDSYLRLLTLAHQVMGGTAFMEEHDLQLYTRRSKAAQQFFGDADFHREIVAQQMGL